MRYTPGELAGDELSRWLTERYCLYTLDERRRVRRADIRHSPWSLRAAELALDRNTTAAPYGLELDGSPPLVHYSARQDVMFWPRGAG